MISISALNFIQLTWIMKESLIWKVGPTGKFMWEPPAPPFNEPVLLSEIATLAFYLKKKGQSILPAADVINPLRPFPF